MKKLFLMIVGAFIYCTSLSAQRVISMTFVGDIDDTPLSHDYPRTPIEVPLVYIDDYTLTFEMNHPNYVLIFKDENGEQLYTVPVYSTQTDVVLPSNLSGNYEIHLVMGNWLFTGWINL
ncbi:MAG: hypothetical protein K6F43_05145 [Prevotella sp.]|nr:hypothetical protein [Prevotella sp.]